MDRNDTFQPMYFEGWAPWIEAEHQELNAPASQKMLRVLLTHLHQRFRDGHNQRHISIEQNQLSNKL